MCRWFDVMFLVSATLRQISTTSQAEARKRIQQVVQHR